MAAQKKLSLDTNFVFDLAAREDFAHDLLEAFQEKAYALLLPPTATREIHFIFTQGEIAKERGMAREALTHLREWGIRPFDLDSATEAVCERFVRSLIRRRLIPDDEFNDGLILAESSVQEAPMLITSDKHLLDVDDEALAIVFSEAELSPVRPVHPRRLLRALR